MTSCRQPGDSGAGKRAWQAVFIDGLRATGNVSEAARGPCGAEGAPGPAGPAGSNATLPTDGLSVGSVVLVRFFGRGGSYPNGFIFRPLADGRPSLEHVGFDFGGRPFNLGQGNRITHGEWRCLYQGRHNTAVWSNGLTGLFVRVA